MQFYTFGLGQELKDPDVTILGGKGYGLSWMDSVGVSVPPGFVIPTTAYTEYATKPKGTMKEIAKYLPPYLAMLKKHFGYAPLLSVRSGARVSCPGMMDTILNVGLEPANKEMWKTKLGKECWENSLHRLITMYGSVVKGVKREDLEGGDYKASLDVYSNTTKEAFPTVMDQLLGSIEAVFKSWNNERAKVYRKLHNIPAEWGTAVVVQAMVFGNLNDQSGTGVLFTRNPDTGERVVTGEFLINAQGEDVVAGIRTPMPLQKMVEWNITVAIELHKTVEKLEAEKKDMQDIEFTVQDGKLYLLQTRNGKRSAQAAIRIAVEMVKENLLTSKEAVQRVTHKQLDLAQIPVIDPAFKTEPMYTGIGACSGVVTGKPVLSAVDAINCKEPCILITKETTPDDIAGMLAAVGVITMEGGLTSHAAVVARGENKPCITGVGADLEAIKCHGGVVSMDGATGRIWLEKVPILAGSTNGFLSEFKEMLEAVVEVTPVITEIPSKPMKEAMLHLGTKMLYTKDAVELIANTATLVDRLYVDFTLTEEAEKQFFSICGFDPQEVVNELQKLFLTFTEKGKKEFESRVILVGDIGSLGFKKVGSVKDLNSLILSSGEVLYSNKEVDEATKWVLNKKKEEGLSMISIGKYVPTARNILSIHQMLEAAKC